MILKVRVQSQFSWALPNMLTCLASFRSIYMPWRLTFLLLLFHTLDISWYRASSFSIKIRCPYYLGEGEICVTNYLRSHTYLETLNIVIFKRVLLFHKVTITGFREKSLLWFSLSYTFWGKILWRLGVEYCQLIFIHLTNCSIVPYECFKVP